MKKIKNKKGFTLIELLAAVVILGILMLVAIPRVSKYIDNSRKDAFIDIAKAYVQEARYNVLNGDKTCPSAGGIIKFEDLNIDKGTKSPFAGKSIDRTKSYVQIDIAGDSYTYSVVMVDNGNNGWTQAKAEDSLSSNDVGIGTATGAQTATSTCN